MEKHDMINISTKVSPEAFAALKVISEVKLNSSIYDVMQMLIDVLIRYCDEQHNLSESMNSLIRLFEGCKDWDKHINMADPIDRKLIAEAIYILREDGKFGSRMKLVEGAYNDLHRTETNNVQTIFDHFMQRFNPFMYNRAKELAGELDCNTLVELFLKLMDLYAEDPNEKQMREMFEDNDYVGVQHQHDERNRQRRTMVNSIEAFERRQTKLSF